MISNTTVLVNMTSSERAAIEGLSFVQWTGAYEPIYKVAPELAGESDPVPAAELTRLSAVDGASASAASEMLDLTIELFDETDAIAVGDLVSSSGGTVRNTSSNIIVCQLPRSGISIVVKASAVAQIYPYEEPSLDMQFARPITRVQQTMDTHGLTGEGEIVAVCDTGLDLGQDNETLHTDFKQLDGVATGRIKNSYALGRPGLWDDPSGHGTHVAGIAVGTGRAATNGRPQSGIAFQAELVMVSVLDANVPPGLSGIPGNLNNLFEPPPIQAQAEELVETG